jgi:hypothetical protein
MARNGLSVVRKVLQEYADRGILRGFNERQGRSGKTEFTFLWLTEYPLHLVCDAQNASVRFNNLLPAMPAKSTAYADLRKFLKERVEGDLPKHRMVAPGRAAVRFVNRQGSVSLVLTVHRNQYRYGVKTILNLVNEIFLLLQRSHTEYMWEHFNLPQE